MIDWNIQSRSQECQSCSRQFLDQEPYHSLLFDQRPGYQRFDVCEHCWTNQYSLGASDRKGFISHWQGVYQSPPAAPPDPIRKETAETLLRKLMEQNDPSRMAASYILAVMLERKRILRVKEQFQRNQQRVFIYEHAKTGDLFTIPDPQLQLSQLETVQRDVAQLLEQGLQPAAANAAVAPEIANPVPTTEEPVSS